MTIGVGGACDVGPLEGVEWVIEPGKERFRRTSSPVEMYDRFTHMGENCTVPCHLIPIQGQNSGICPGMPYEGSRVTNVKLA